MAEVEINIVSDHLCPRRPEAPAVFKLPNTDHWIVRNDPEHPGLMNNGLLTCDYCGSMNPEDLLKKIREGWEIGPTDKTYKVYVKGPKEHGKFYFQHFSPDQRREFIDLLNAGEMKIGVPGHFYVLPFFVKRGP